MLVSPRAMDVKVSNDTNRLREWEKKALEESLKNWIETMDSMRLASMVRGVHGLLDKLSSRRLTRGMPKTTKMKILTITMLVLPIMVVVESNKGHRRSPF